MDTELTKTEKEIYEILRNSKKIKWISVNRKDCAALNRLVKKGLAERFDDPLGSCTRNYSWRLKGDF